MSPHKISVKLRLSGFTGELNILKPGGIGRPLRGLLYKARSPEEIKSSDGRLGQWLGGDWKLVDNVGK